MTPNISVIIPTFNSGRTIARCLDSIRGQESGTIEVIVVDSGSTDGSPEFAEKWGAFVIRTSSKRSAARNLGAKKSNSDVFFLDSDMRLSSPNIIKECVESLDNHEALIIPEISQGEGYWATCKSLERRTTLGNMVLEAARCFTRESFTILGGYDERLDAGEDWDLQNRAIRNHMSIGRVKGQVIHDEGHLTLGRAVRKKYEYGKTIGRYIASYPSFGFTQINPVRRILLPSLKVFPHDPVHGIGIAFLKTLEFAAAGVGHVSRNRP